MQINLFLIISLFFLIICCSVDKKEQLDKKNTDTTVNVLTRIDSVNSILDENSDFIADGFDFPVEKPNPNGYYNSQKFGINFHLGEDWNSTEGGNSDLGDPIYSIGNGYVNFAKDIGVGWGNVVRIWHKTSNGKIIESLYAHCDSILVKKGDFVQKGQQIATIGTANGRYIAHLHFEIRDNVNLSIGEGYSTNPKGYLNPTSFINKNR
ncbi:MAG: M23 family metallopeptidase [Bacteroidales bacterium]|nr:M23 family metallopeptidase [Bacteroidales bacterium]